MADEPGASIAGGPLAARLAHTWGLRVLVDRHFVRRLAAVLLVLVLVYRAVQLVAWSQAPQWGYDFSAYWTAARHLLDGEPLYTAAQLAGPYAPQGQLLYLYPPFAALLAIPFALLWPSDYGAAAAVWALLGAIVVAAVVVGIARLERLGRMPSAWFLVGAAFAFPPVVGELVLGNVHLVLLGLFALAWWGVRRGGAGGEALAGIAVAAATLIKVFPVLLVVWFLASGRVRAALWTALGGLLLALATLPVTGPQPWLDYPRVLLNLGPPADATDALAPSVWLGTLLGPGPARIAVVVVALGLVTWSARRQTTAASYGIAVVAAVLVAPAVFQHYLAILVLPLLLAIASTPAAAAPRAALTAAYLAMWGGQQPLLGGFAWLLNRAIPTLGALAVAGTLLRWGRSR